MASKCMWVDHADFGVVVKLFEQVNCIVTLINALYHWEFHVRKYEKWMYFLYNEYMWQLLKWFHDNSVRDYILQSAHDPEEGLE